METRPYKAQAHIDGLWYKIGRHHHVYKWVGNEWVKSTRKKSEIMHVIKANLVQVWKNV